MSIDLNQLIKTIRERDIRKVLDDYKDRNELINDLFDVLNTNFTKKQIVKDCFFVLYEIDSHHIDITNTIWNDLTLTTKIELQSKSLDLLELQRNYNINTIIIEFIKSLYHNHRNEIDEYQSILQSISKRYIKNNNIEFRYSCLELINFILKSNASSEQINEFESSLSNMIEITFEQINDTTMYFINFFLQITFSNFLDLEIDGEPIVRYLSARYEDFINNEAFDELGFLNFYEAIFELADSNQLDENVIEQLLGYLVGALQSDATGEELKEKFFTFILSQFLKLSDDDIKQWESQEKEITAPKYAIHCLYVLVSTLPQLVYRNFKVLKEIVVVSGDWKKIAGLAHLETITIEEYIKDYTFIGAFKSFSEYFTHPEPLLRENYLEVTHFMLNTVEPNEEQTNEILDTLLKLNDSHPIVQNSILRTLTTLVRVANSTIDKRLSNITDYFANYMNIELPTAIVEGVVNVLTNLCEVMFANIASHAKEYLPFFMSIIHRSDRFDPLSRTTGAALEAISILIMESKGSIDEDFKHSLEIVEIIKRNMPPHTNKMINVLDFQWDEIKQLSKESLNYRIEVIDMTLSLIEILADLPHL
ncbi:hypothetical protein PPL_07643 [Heterostelium album PN500]|uniref:Uncharacterized protein n=1 Tax=Heterostelium pallidum (strain ATCC 26659 / Pp 5 / PN500) TaxID=670386 RepID=D3BGJ1_HETP5|nr:hypothetical protein PPL_07643 [Heterostelium album PN500]EFA79225.1 hypothetical protein PPL_07643 [Heterostelium album PN500]|eukprot:XP_020431346.1 hypothetical protein PPL_07643 [Heterostelium album PN500]